MWLWSLNQGHPADLSTKDGTGYAIYINIYIFFSPEPLEATHFEWDKSECKVNAKCKIMLTNIWTISIFERFSTWQTWQKLHPGLPWRIWLCGSQGHNSFVSATLWLCTLGQKSQTWHMTNILGLREGLEMFWRCLDSNLDYPVVFFAVFFGDMAFVCWMYSTCENRICKQCKHLNIWTDDVEKPSRMCGAPGSLCRTVSR